MSTLTLIPPRDPRLRTVCEPVTFHEPFDLATARKMAMLMDEHNGVGLAAPQVGLLQRFFVLRLTDTSVIVVINPEIVRHGNQEVEGIEGCLSFPGMSKTKMRHRVIDVRFQSPRGRPVGMTLKGSDAIRFQHEFDHLNGIVLFDESEIPVPAAQQPQEQPVVDQPIVP